MARVGETLLSTTGIAARSRALRTLADAIQPDEPFGNPERDALPPIRLVVPIAGKDAMMLRLVVKYAMANSANPVKEVLIVMPEKDIGALTDTETSWQIQTDEEIVGQKLLTTIERLAGRRHGWLVQQVVKFCAVFNTELAGCLVVDADTILVHPRVWLMMDGSQLLSFSNEYHEPYDCHFDRVWGKSRRYRGLSYVTHHQLMQPDIVREMFGDRSGIQNWLEMANLSHPSAISEYHCYGVWLTTHARTRVRMARWGNSSVVGHYSLTELEEYAEQRSRQTPLVFSLSNHSYQRLRSSEVNV